MSWTLLVADSAPAKEPSLAMEMARQLNQAFIEVVEQVSPAVVVVRVAHRADYQDPDGEEDSSLWDSIPPRLRKFLEEHFRDEPPPRERRPDRRRGPDFDGQGSGVIIREDGYILTNHHVVEGADRIRVRFRDGREYDAKVRGTDARSDIAVLKIEAADLKTAVLGNSDRTRVGEFAIAIGAPFELDYSVTVGHVSAKGRSAVLNSPDMDQDFIQTDASINPGNSGGPLVNLNGEVIGINTMIRGLNSGIGFAIPVNLARTMADQLIADGKVTRAWLGINIQALRDYPEYRELVKETREGVVVRGIMSQGPASRSDLRPGDVITAVDGKSVATTQELRHEVRAKRVGSNVQLSVRRNGRPVEVTLKTEEWPDREVMMAARQAPSKEEPAVELGLKVENLTADVAKQHKLDSSVEGVVVTEVESDSPASAARIKVGDVITEVNQRTVRTTEDFRKATQRASLAKGVVVHLTGEDGPRFEILKERGE